MYFEVGFVIVVILIDIIIMRIYLKQRKQSPPKPKVQKPTKETEDANAKDQKPKQKTYIVQNSKKSQEPIVELARKSGGNNIVTRHDQTTAVDLDNFDRTTPLAKESYRFRGNNGWTCYGCGRITQNLHPVYIFSCRKCGSKFQQRRNFTRDLHGQVSLVIGSRTKLGHQVALKLLRAGSVVIGTTRYPEKAAPLFEGYADYKEWSDKFDIYNKGLDLDTEGLSDKFNDLAEYIQKKYNKLDNLIICAAQTIRVREKEKEQVLYDTQEHNRYGDAKFVEEKYVNSWQMKVKDITQEETEECMRINAIAPVLLVKAMTNVMKKSDNIPYIISVHAKEGIFSAEKGSNHIHTNMAKAALHMMTRTLIEDKSLVTEKGKTFSIHGCDPGWISVDEYYENNRPFIIPPLDERDGAARVLWPLFKKFTSSGKTRKQFDTFLY